MSKVFLSAKLLMVFVERGCGRDVVDASKQGGAKGGTRLLGRGPEMGGTPRDACAECCGQDVVLILMREEAESVVNAVIAGSFPEQTGYAGIAVIIDVPNILLRPGFTGARGDAASPGSGGSAMQPGFTLISSIMNHGQAEDLMAVAREAGARGGTILNARGTGTEEDVQFFGISLAPEKEMLLIIAENTQARAILEALSSQSVFSEPGGGIIFTTAVEEFIVLGS